MVDQLIKYIVQWINVALLIYLYICLRNVDNMKFNVLCSILNSVFQRMAPEMAAVERLGGYDLKVCFFNFQFSFYKFSVWYFVYR